MSSGVEQKRLSPDDGGHFTKYQVMIYYRDSQSVKYVYDKRLLEHASKHTFDEDKNKKNKSNIAIASDFGLGFR